MKVEDLDTALSTPARLAIVATLVPGQPWTFTALGEETGIADGNLHVQTRKLLEAGYLTRERVRRGGRPATRFQITDHGRLAFRQYIRRLRAAADAPAAAPGATTGARTPHRSDPARVW
ncbi:MAG: transcriptional regulator [Candidatus Krumholzibacteriia bacterium]